MSDIETKPYEGLKFDMLELVGISDPNLMTTLTDFQVGQLVRKHVHGLRTDADKFKNALAEDVKRGKGCKVCFYTGFQMCTIGGFGTLLDPDHFCEYCEEKS